MGMYHVWVNCIQFQRIVVEADSPEEAENAAVGYFGCQASGEGEVDHGETRIATEDDIAMSEDYS